jgi:hypothetical protein
LCYEFSRSKMHVHATSIRAGSLNSGRHFIPFHFCSFECLQIRSSELGMSLATRPSRGQILCHGRPQLGVPLKPIPSRQPQ